MKKWIALIKLGYNSIRLIRDPSLLDEVIQMSQTLIDEEKLSEIENHLRLKGAEVSDSFESRPRLGKVDVAALSKLPDGTLGKSFADFIVAHQLDPNALPTMKADSPHEYVLAHLYETHDLWHVITGFKPDVAGELGLQAFYAAQFPSALAMLIFAIGYLNTLFFAFSDRDNRMQAIADGWMMGKKARSLFGRDWKMIWDQPLSEVRMDFNLSSI